MELTICFPPHSPLILRNVDENFSVPELKEKLSTLLPGIPALRGHDRAMSNLENIPEGFSHLKKVYSTLQEPMYDAFTPKTRFNYTTADAFENSTEADKKEKIRMTTSEPIPNPWAPKTTIPVNTTNSRPLFGSQKRKLTSSLDEDLLLFNRNVTGIAELGLTSPLNPVQRELYTQQLMEMHLLGFVNDEENVAALVECDGNVSLAIDRIIAKRRERQ